MAVVSPLGAASVKKPKLRLIVCLGLPPAVTVGRCPVPAQPDWYWGVPKSRLQASKGTCAGRQPCVEKGWVSIQAGESKTLSSHSFRIPA